jgi:molybdenum cofactor guanylyltransferase
MLTHPIPAVILAGGRGMRMGRVDKPLLDLGGQTLLSCILVRLKLQTDIIVLSANGDPDRFAAYHLPILQDPVHDAGPMAGIAAAMLWARSSVPEASHILSVSGDTPFLPTDLTERLVSAKDLENAQAAVSVSAGRRHGTFAVWPITMAESILAELNEGRGRRVLDWLVTHEAVEVEWSTEPYDPFFNINTLDDLNTARALATLLNARDAE